MVKGTQVSVDVKTGVETISEVEHTPVAEPTPPKGIDIEKLKAALLAQGVINNKSEVE